MVTSTLAGFRSAALAVLLAMMFASSIASAGAPPATEPPEKQPRPPQAFADDPQMHGWIAWQAYQVIPASELRTELGQYIGSYADATGYDDNFYSGSSLLEGAYDEDEPVKFDGKYNNHFWIPEKGLDGKLVLPTWMTVYGVPDESAIRRARNYWDDEVTPSYRRSLYGFLSSDLRELYRRVAYYKLGWIAHLLADMGSPAHSRGDPHPGRKFIFSSSYFDAVEDWTVLREYNGELNYKQYTYSSIRGAHSLLQVPRAEELQLQSSLPAYEPGLARLFSDLATTSARFESQNKDGTHPSHTKHHSVTWPYGTAADGTWSDRNGYSNQYYMTKQEAQDHCDVTVPRAIQCTAALYRMFWDFHHTKIKSPDQSSRRWYRGKISVEADSEGSGFFPSSGGASYCKFEYRGNYGASNPVEIGRAFEYGDQGWTVEWDTTKATAGLPLNDPYVILQATLYTPSLAQSGIEPTMLGTPPFVTDYEIASFTWLTYSPIGVDNTPPTGRVVINGGAASTATRQAYLTLTTEDGTGSQVGWYRVRNEGESFGTYVPIQPQVSWTLRAGDAGSRRLYVQFKDNAGNESVAEASATIQYQPAAVTNRPPEADAGSDQTATSGATVFLVGRATDLDGGTLTYSWTMTSRPAGSNAFVTFSSTAGTASFLADVSGSYYLTLTVRDSGNLSDTDNVRVDVGAPQNHAPDISAGFAILGSVGTRVTLAGSASDPDQDPLTISWTMAGRPTGSSATLQSGSTLSPWFVPDAAGTYTLQLSVQDGRGGNKVASTTVVVAQPPVQQPWCSAGADQTGTVGTTVYLDASASSPAVDSSQLQYTWQITSRPSNSNASLSFLGTPRTDFLPDTAGGYDVQLLVQDGRGGHATDAVHVDISQAINHNPVAIPGNNVSVHQGSLVRLQGAATDIDQDALTYSWSLTRPTNSATQITNLSAGAAFFTADVTGTYVCTVAVSDGRGGHATGVLYVTAFNTLPDASAGADRTAAVGTAVALVPTGSDADQDSLTYSWHIASKPVASRLELLAPWARYQSITPDVAGDFVIRLTVTDSYGASRTTDVTIHAHTALQREWTQRFPSTAPAARAGHMMAYTENLGKVLLFGGFDGTVGFNDTWEWDGGSWTQQFPASSPPARWMGTMLYHKFGGGPILFGGYRVINATTFEALNDTWRWDGTNWIQLTPATRPPARYQMGLALDHTQGKMVVFGGVDQSLLDDMWGLVWSTSTWARLSPPSSPTPRRAHAVGDDFHRGQVLIFGGTNGVELDDTWTWDGVTWTQRNPPQHPSARQLAATAFNQLRKRIFLFGGITSGGYPTDDSWEWTGSSWAKLIQDNPPGARHSAGLAYDELRNEFVLFGGYNGTSTNDTNYPNRLGDTWTMPANMTPIASPGPDQTVEAGSVVTLAGTATDADFFFDEATGAPVRDQMASCEWLRWSGTTVGRKSRMPVIPHQQRTSSGRSPRNGCSWHLKPLPFRVPASLR